MHNILAAGTASVQRLGRTRKPAEPKVIQTRAADLPFPLRAVAAGIDHVFIADLR
ncbi:hypothetical protein [Nocardia suismassiliense]|uniref:hypothetical protein n=1 Tax=Nocardia suismassiliense TaxID=2077092 RepID=UPI00131F46E4|nr:hypothetical protein [Nocardia suismassiliense]